MTRKPPQDRQPRKPLAQDRWTRQPPAAGLPHKPPHPLLLPEPVAPLPLLASLLPLLVWGAGVAAATVTGWQDALLRLGLSLLGAAAAAAAVLLWGQAMRPRNHGAWWMAGGVAAIACLASPEAVPAVAAAGAALLAATRADGAPSSLLLLGQPALLWQPGADWGTAGRAEAVAVAAGALLVLAAAALARTRLAAAVEATPPAWWTFGMLTFAALACAAAIVLAEAVEGRGLVPDRTSGRVALLGALVATLAAAGAAWWRPRTATPPS
ncbi:MAG TPA: hypothetical protein VFH47_02885 [Candidatus Thermoplasmatota archaeon]|nr:hypothetical protein [Candidatus Thermoplasmatota archaeon]